jgi:transcriptional regulator with XRE-family HTH domain
MNLFEYVSQRIRDLRTNYGGGKGISQEMLAKKLGVAPNTISRWETGTYRPSLEDLDKLARFFAISVLEFFPSNEAMADDRVSALLRAAKQLSPKDLDELRRFAEFRRARSIFTPSKRQRSVQKREKTK